MPSLSKTSTAGKPLLLCCAPLLFLLVLLGVSRVQGASLREHRLRGTEPNGDMLKALEYIESLHQKTGTDPRQKAPHAPEYDTGHPEDTAKLRALLGFTSSNPTEDVKEEEEAEEGEKADNEDKTEEWLQAVLSTLQQTEKAPKPASRRPSAAHLSLGNDETQMDEKDREYPWVQQQHGIKPHKKHPLMFEDDEEGEGDEEEEGEGGAASDHESPFKRTNENVEEKYTPQNLATLQSVFEELGRLTNAKAAAHKRQVEDGDEEVNNGMEDNNDDADMLDVRNLAFQDIAGGLADWDPLEEQEEEEEEEEARHNKHEADRGLDYGDDEEEEDDDNDNIEDEEEGDESYPVKRSSNSGPQADADMANLVDYYLLKVLEKTEEEEHKREVEEEKKRAERRVAQSHYRDDIDPQAIYQLIHISQKLQIPPEDLIDMLKTGELTNQDKGLLRNQAQAPRKANTFSRVEDKLSQISSKKQHKSPPEATFYNRRLPDRQTISNPEDVRTQEILNILGLGGTAGSQDPAPLRKQKHLKSSQSRLYTYPGGHSRESAATQRRLPDKLKDDYDDTVGEDELAAYLAAQILAEYPKSANNGNNKASQKRDEAGQTVPGSFEEAIQDYFEEMDSDKSPPQKRQSEDEVTGGAAQSWDDEALMMKLLSYLNPETQESDDDVKTVQGM